VPRPETLQAERAAEACGGAGGVSAAAGFGSCFTKTIVPAALLVEQGDGVVGGADAGGHTRRGGGRCGVAGVGGVPASEGDHDAEELWRRRLCRCGRGRSGWGRGRRLVGSPAGS